MIVKLLLLLSVGCLAFTPLNHNKAAEDDVKMIEGTWIPVSAELGGQKLPESMLKDAKLTLTDGNYTYQIDQGTYKLIPAAGPKAPKAMDIISVKGPNHGKTFLAIYELAGDTLKICYDLEGKTRPNEFTTKAGTKQFLVYYQRAKS